MSKETIAIEAQKYEKLAQSVKDLSKVTMQYRLYDQAKSYVKDLIAGKLEERCGKKRAEHPDWGSFVVWKDESSVVVSKPASKYTQKTVDHKGAIEYLEKAGLMEKATEAKAIYGGRPQLNVRFQNSPETQEDFKQKWEVQKAYYDAMKDGDAKTLTACYANICKQASYYEDKKEILTKTVAKRLRETEEFKANPEASFKFNDTVSLTMGKSPQKINRQLFAEIAGKDKLEEFTKTNEVENSPTFLIYSPASYEKHIEAVKKILEKKEQNKEVKEMQFEEVEQAQEQEQIHGEDERNDGFEEYEDADYSDWNDR